jgi:hypothetical protein
MRNNEQVTDRLVEHYEKKIEDFNSQVNMLSEQLTDAKMTH